MRATRLGRALRRADWTAFILDVVVLALGLLLAFQLDRWWEAERKRADEQAYLTRLKDETRENIKRLEELVKHHTRAAAIARELYGPGPPPANGALAEQPFRQCSMLHLPGAIVVNTAYDELAGSNRIEILRDSELRRSLGSAMALHQFSREQLPFFRDGFINHQQVLHPYERYSIQADGEVRCVIDRDALLQDERARNLLPGVYRSQRVFASYRAREVSALRAVEARLSR